MRGDINDYAFDLLVTKAGIEEDKKANKKLKQDQEKELSKKRHR